MKPNGWRTIESLYHSGLKREAIQLVDHLNEAGSSKSTPPGFLIEPLAEKLNKLLASVQRRMCV